MRKLALFMFLSFILISRASFAYDFAVIGDPSTTKAVNNIYYLFTNEGITYKSILPSQVTSSSFNDVTGGIVSFADVNSIPTAGITAVKTFANSQNHIVISDAYDFANYYYSDLNSSYKTVNVYSNDYITYLMDFGNFRSQDTVGIQSPDKTLIGILSTSALQSKFGSNLTLVAKYSNTYTAYFYVNSTPNTGFYVIDLNITTNESTWNGIWHIFQPVRMVKDFPLGKYARWMANGSKWWDINWINNFVGKLANDNSDIAKNITIGTTVQGRNITAIIIGNGNRYAIIDGDIHGDEKTGAFASLRMAELLIGFYHSDPSWQAKLNQYKVIIIPVLNPDGFASNTRLNANGVDLNANFPTSASSPPNYNGKQNETVALMKLFDSYKPTIYINNHEACCHYPLWMIYGNKFDLNNTYTNSTLYSLKQSSKEYSNLKNWGTDHQILNATSGKCILQDTPMASVSSTREGTKDGMAIEYASVLNISTYLLESYVCSGSYGSKQGLWGIDTYSTIDLAFLKHYDRNNEKNFSVASTSFIINTTFAGDLLTVKLDSNGYPSPSTTFITDINNKGEPISVSIDGLNKVENDGWYYDSTTKNITIRGAVKILTVDWNPGSSGPYIATFSQSGIPSGTSWSVSVGGTIYTSTSTSKDVSLTGAAPYTYTTPISQYVCTSGCSGSVAYNSKKANAVYSIQGGGGCGPGCYLRAIEPYILNTEPIATTLFLLLVVVEVIILILVIKILSKIEATNKKNINSRHHK